LQKSKTGNQLNNISEAIVLAGGLGTRLRSAVPHLPKCMAPVAGRPFVSHVIDYYREQGIERFIFSLGYLHGKIEEYLDAHYKNLSKKYVVEAEPLGTGGAIRLACEEASTENILVLNGDTIFKINLEELARAHHQYKAQCTLCLKPMQNFDRYGVVELNEDSSVKSFLEKKYYENGNINGGVYALNRTEFAQKNFPAKFSFEKDYLEKEFQNRKLYGLVQDAYFIDIGIPEDFEKAQVELAGIGKKR
jgi:D-glycero-alpha-D-manno-heptose 1-phosphate guanylyltransferase